MAISEKTIKILWSRAAGRCSYPDCSEILTLPEAGSSAPHTIGEMAHIKGNKPASSRHDQKQPSEERDAYENLILLCPTHHTKIDKPENETAYTVAQLVDYKRRHEAFVEERLSASELSTLAEIKDAISVFLSENESAWRQFGPHSEAARKNPNNQEVYAVWCSERLAIIIPNNRRIVSILNDHREMFQRTDQRSISEFIRHVSSYELWINDVIPYQAVLRFPYEFEQLIMEN